MHKSFRILGAGVGAKEAECLLVLMADLDKDVKFAPVPLFVDNIGIVSMVFNPVDHQSNKHVKLICHCTRELVENKIVTAQRIPTDINIADIFTKLLGPQLFRSLSEKFMSTPNAILDDKILFLAADEHSDDLAIKQVTLVQAQIRKQLRRSLKILCTPSQTLFLKTILTTGMTTIALIEKSMME